MEAHTRSKTGNKGPKKVIEAARKNSAGTTTTANKLPRERRGKRPENLKDDVLDMAQREGVDFDQANKDQKDTEAIKAVEQTSDKAYLPYSKQAAVEKLKQTRKTKPTDHKEGNAFSLSYRRSPRQKRGINAPPSEEEIKLPPSKRHRASGDLSERAKVKNEANRRLADTLYELADYVLHADETQKGISYQKAAKEVRVAEAPIKSKAEARKLPGIGSSIADKVEEFLKTDKITVLEEYRSGQRGM